MPSVQRDVESIVLQSFNPAGIASPSTRYHYPELIKALREMAREGITSGGREFKFYAPTGERSMGYGRANLAAFLANAMVESIAHDTCDEFNIDEVADRYALSNACGQNGRSYQDEVCANREEWHMSCPVVSNMESVSSGYAAGMSGRAPPPFFCRPKERFDDYAGYWDRFTGMSSNSAYANARGRTDVEGCCWWGRGALLTRGVCNIGKLNYFLGKRAYDERGEGRFPTIDFCAHPEAVCASEEGKEEMRWITGFFEWIERIQQYPDWDYISNLRKFVDGGMNDDSFIDTVSSIFTLGCHQPNCSYLTVTKKEERRANFKLILEIIYYSVLPDETFAPVPRVTPYPTPRPVTPPPVKGILPPGVWPPSAPASPSNPMSQLAPSTPVYQPGMDPSMPSSQSGQSMPVYQPGMGPTMPSSQSGQSMPVYQPGMGPTMPSSQSGQSMPVYQPGMDPTMPMSQSTPSMPVYQQGMDPTMPMSQPSSPSAGWFQPPTMEQWQQPPSMPGSQSNPSMPWSQPSPQWPTEQWPPSGPNDGNTAMRPTQPSEYINGGSPVYSPFTDRPTRKRPSNRPRPNKPGSDQLIVLEDNLAYYLCGASWWIISMMISILCALYL